MGETHVAEGVTAVLTSLLTNKDVWTRIAAGIQKAKPYLGEARRADKTGPQGRHPDPLGGRHSLNLIGCSGFIS